MGLNSFNLVHVERSYFLTIIKHEFIAGIQFAINQLPSDTNNHLKLVPIPFLNEDFRAGWQLSAGVIKLC